MMRGSAFYIPLFVFLLISCQYTTPPQVESPQARPIPNKYAELFELSLTKNDTFLTVYNPEKKAIGLYSWGKSMQTSKHLKINRGNTYVALSAVFARMISELQLGIFTQGVDNANYIPQDVVLSENCTSLQTSGILNKEALLKLKPQITFTYLLDGRGDKEWQRLSNNEHTVVFIQNHLESHPLARAEWIRAMGWILGKPHFADSLFNTIETGYLALKKQGKTHPNAQTVMLNLPFEGIWHIPNKSAYFTQLLLDANFKPSWLTEGSFNGTGASSLPLENAINMIQESAVWLNLGAITRRNEITQYDTRLKRFLSQKDLRFFQNDKQLESKGANSYWDLGAVHPEMLLHDLIQIQQNASTEALYFYREI
jgi:ABC-type Fe3+-hydroxamate transport system substrate-binding protein